MKTLNRSLVTGIHLVIVLCVALLVSTSAHAQSAELSLAPNPKLLNFGTATSNSPDTLYDTIRNIGAPGTKLGISNIAFTGSIYYSQISGAQVGDSIPSGNYELIGIQFLPFAYGTETGTLTVTTTGVDSGTQATSLTGISAIPSVSFSASTMFSGTKVRVTDTSSVQYLYVSSTGIGPLAITGVSIIGRDGSRACFITRMPAGTIPAGGKDSIGVRFTPDFEGIPDARIVIASNAVNIPSDTVIMEGVGTLPHLSIDSGSTHPLPLKLNFDSIGLGASSCLQFQLWNPGSDTVAITKNYFEDADRDFTFTPLTGRDTLIPPGGTANIQVCFTPIKAGTRVATLRILTDIPLTETTPPKDTSSFVVDIVGIGDSVGRPSIRTFGPLNGDTLIVGKQYCVTDTFWNNGTAPLIIDSVRNLIPSVATFTFPTFPLTIPPDSIVTFGECITLTDTGTFNGECSDGCASVITFSQAPVYSNSQLAMTVYGIEIGSEFGLESPFSPVTCVGDSSLGILYVMNDGNVPDVYSVALARYDSADFKFITPTTSPTIPGGGIYTFGVQFTPSKSGIEETEVITTRKSDGSSSGGLFLDPSGGAAKIYGSGTAPLTAVGDTTTFTGVLHNTGTCPCTPGVPHVSEPFIYVSGGTTEIDPGDSATLTFQFAPTSTTVAGYTDAVTFPNAVGVSIPPADMDLTGNAKLAAGVPIVASSNGYSLDQNYPNPFGASSQVEITLPVGGMVNLSIINAEGQVVQTVLNQHFDAGTFGVTLKADGLASGTYYYQMTAGGVTLTRQMVILK
jgi:hypothetical protein